MTKTKNFMSTDTIDSIVDLIVDDGDKKGSLPSTIVLLKNDGWKVLRQGSVIV